MFPVQGFNAGNCFSPLLSADEYLTNPVYPIEAYLSQTPCRDQMEIFTQNLSLQKLG